MATDGPNEGGGPQRSGWLHATEAVQRFGPAASVAGYGVVNHSAWMVLAGAVLELVQEPIRKVLMGVADEIGSALGLRLKRRILGVSSDNGDQLAHPP